MGACFYALAHITTRAKCQDVSLSTMAFSVNITMFVAGGVMSMIVLLWSPEAQVVEAYPSVLGGWTSISVQEWAVLALLALFVIVIGMTLAGAYQSAPASTVATFEYSYLVFVVIWGFLFFDLVPSIATGSGMVLIFLAGILALNANVQKS